MSIGEFFIWKYEGNLGHGRQTCSTVSARWFDVNSFENTPKENRRSVGYLSEIVVVSVFSYKTIRAFVRLAAPP